MKATFVLVSMFLVIHAHSQTPLEKEITSLVRDSLSKGKYLHFEVLTGDCELSGKRDIEVLFHGYKDPQATMKDKYFRSFSLLMSFFINDHILIHHPDIDCITISQQTEGQEQKLRATFYLLGGNVLYDDNGKMRVNDGNFN